MKQVGLIVAGVPVLIGTPYKQPDKISAEPLKKAPAAKKQK